MFRLTSRIGAGIIAVLMAVAMGAPALAAAGASIRVVDADLQAGRSSVQLTVKVSCHAPAGATSYLSTTIWQGNSLHPEQARYLEGQGQMQIVCDGARHAYSFTATTTARVPPNRAAPRCRAARSCSTRPRTKPCCDRSSTRCSPTR